MPEGLLEQQENPAPMMDVFSPEGTKGKIPSAQFSDYQQKGFKAAVRVTSPSGTGGWLPNDKVGDYVKNQGFKLGPPEQQKLGGEQSVTAGPKSGISMNAPVASLVTGITSGAGIPETQHPVRDLARGMIAPPNAYAASGADPEHNNPAYSRILTPQEEGIMRSANEGRPWWQKLLGVGADLPPDIQAKFDARNKAHIENAYSNYAPSIPIVSPAIAASANQADKSIQAAKEGRPYEAVVRGAGAAVPVIGPAAVEAGHEIGQGVQNKDVDQALHGIGTGFGMVGGLALGTEKGQAATERAVPVIARPVEALGDATASLAKRGVQNVKTAINPVKNMTAGELATKAVHPRNSKTNFPQELETALPDTKRALQNAGIDQSNMTLHDVLDAATQAKKDVWAEYQQNHSGPAGALPIDTTPIADAMLAKITPRMRTQQPGLVKQIEANAAEYSGKSMAAQDLEARVGEANNETRGIEAKYLTDKTAAKLDPSNAALFAERDTARQLLLNKLDEATGPGAADLRKRYGNLTSFQDVVSRRIPVADRAAPMNLNQIVSRGYGMAKIAKGVWGLKPGDIAEGATSLWFGKNADLMNNPNELVRHAFDKTEATPAARPYVAPPTPEIRGLLPPAPTELPGNVEPINQGREGLLPAASRIDENGRVQYLTSPAERGSERAPIARPSQQETAAPIPVKPTEPPQGAPAAEQPTKALPSYITENRGRWFTPDRNMATGYARGGKVYAVDVPDEVAKQTDETRVQGRPEHILPDVWLSKSRPVEEMGQPPTGTVRLFRGEAPREEPELANDRRENIQQRKLVSEMSPEEREKALLTSETVGLPNKRAFVEAEQSGKSPAVAMSDADGLKAFNDTFGYEAGNQLLKAKAEALKEAGLDVYHDKGDEFLGRGESEDSLKQKYEKAREILRNREIEVTQADGSVRIYKGADFSYGTGKDLAAAEKGLKSHKASREASGERARGELRGIVEVRPKAGQENTGAPQTPPPIARPPKSNQRIPPDATAKADKSGNIVGVKPGDTNTPEFKQWFSGSKVADSEGRPLTVYHGTSEPFDRVDMSKGAQGTFWLTTDKAAVERGESGATSNAHILEAHVSIKNPAGWDEYEKKSIDELIRDGYDGVILPEGGHSNIIAFEPDQVRIIKGAKASHAPIARPSKQ